MKENKYSVYLHTCISNKKRYVGKSSRNPLSRWGTNGRGYLTKRNEKFVQPQIARAILKYGWDNFEHEILMSDLTNEEACFWEKFFIFLFRSNNPIYGYNGTSGGEGSPDKKISAESRRKMSVAQKKRFENPEEREKISLRNKGNKTWSRKHHSDESKQKMSRTWKEIFNSPRGEKIKAKAKETNDLKKEEIRKNNGGYFLSEETRRKMSEEQKTNGAHRQRKKHTEQSKKKMSESHKGLQIGENHPFSKKVRCIETGEVFESMSLAAKAKGNQSASPHIGSCCRGERKICLGFHWEFV